MDILIATKSKMIYIYIYRSQPPVVRNSLPTNCCSKKNEVVQFLHIYIYYCIISVNLTVLRFLQFSWPFQCCSTAAIPRCKDSARCPFSTGWLIGWVTTNNQQVDHIINHISLYNNIIINYTLSTNNDNMSQQTGPNLFFPERTTFNKRIGFHGCLMGNIRHLKGQMIK